MSGKVSIRTVRRILADYMQSEGCSCCRNDEPHEKAEAKLAKLLGVPKYSDGSGFNFNRFATTPTRFRGDEVEPIKEAAQP